MTNNLENRINEHLSKSKKGAKYTKSHNAIKLEAAWKSNSKSLACKLEYQIKNLTKQQKENLINGGKLTTYLKGKIELAKITGITPALFILIGRKLALDNFSLPPLLVAC